LRQEKEGKGGLQFKKKKTEVSPAKRAQETARKKTVTKGPIRNQGEKRHSPGAAKKLWKQGAHKGVREEKKDYQNSRETSHKYVQTKGAGESKNP